VYAYGCLPLGLVHHLSTIKRLLTDEETRDDNGDGCADSAASTAEPRYLLASVYDYVFMQTPINPTTVQARVCV